MTAITRAEALARLENKETVLDRIGNTVDCIGPLGEYFLPYTIKPGDVWEHNDGSIYTVVRGRWRHYNLINGTDLYSCGSMEIGTFAKVLENYFKKPETKSEMPAVASTQRAARKHSRYNA